MRRTLLVLTLAVLGAALLSVASTGSAAVAPPLRGNGRPSPLRANPPFKLPRPPGAPGCYRYAPRGGWARRQCESKEYVLSHYPRPGSLQGIQLGEKVSLGPTSTVWSPIGPPLQDSTLVVDPIDNQIVGESDSKKGSDAYSLQINTNGFEGNNSNADWVQFVDQVTSAASNNVCVWQIDLNTGSYDPTCGGYSGEVFYMEGYSYGGLLGVAVSGMPLTHTATAVVTPDIYGLGSGYDWNETSGGILGFGNGSEAVFTRTELYTALLASPCISDGGFFTGYSVFCGPKLKPFAYTTFYPSTPPSTGYPIGLTLESNNLMPVIGSPPKHLTSLFWTTSGYVAHLDYASTTSGKCWTGKPPYCE